MIAVDSNILIYAHRRDSEWHTPAAAALGTLAASGSPWAIPWSCAHEFYSVVTHPGIYSPPSTRDEACGQLDSWIASPALVMLGEDTGYWPELREVLVTGRISGPRVHDARIATICMRHGVAELWTADRDFSRFAGLRTRNPLTDRGSR